MRQIVYKYNEETCQYERMRVRTPDVVFYVSGLVVVAILMLAGMLFLHDYFIDSEKEISLRNENAALKKNYGVLTSQLGDIESTLEHLEVEDQKLHQKFFGTDLVSVANENATLLDKNVLLADPSDFRKAINNVNEESSKLLMQSSITTGFFSGELGINKAEINKIIAMPVLLPTKPWNAESVMSGYGMRINPFHKGLYQHEGIDIAMPRGTDVVATASGTVTEVKRSNVQAGYGNYIVIDHSGGFTTRYAHLDEIKVSANQRIKKGSTIGTIGNSGGSIAPHLHYEIIKNGQPLNPIYYMVEGLNSDQHHQLKLISEKKNQSLD
jgi:murein DD-endopeptidase MepM/ murein hydrolase activator NlpD